MNNNLAYNLGMVGRGRRIGDLSPISRSGSIGSRSRSIGSRSMMGSLGPIGRSRGIGSNSMMFGLSVS